MGFGVTYPALRGLFTETHAVPRFEGRDTRRHLHAPLWKLLAQARYGQLSRFARLRSLETFVQFAGFPRSGHSLIGSLLDAHPRARIAHELDAMGLLYKGFSLAAVFALLDRNSAEFTRHGRYWNGFSYLVPGGHHDHATGLRVIGDKKGDWAVRWIAREPGLLRRLEDEPRTTKKWILVLRNPFDNIATMSLRQGREYDRLRISTRNSTEFREALRKRQGDTIAAEALDSMIDDYASLCATVERMKQTTPPECWFELHYEDFLANPQTGMESLLEFLGLDHDEEYIRNCSFMVNNKPGKSRQLVDWSLDKRNRVQSLITQFSVLNRYESDNDF